MSPGSLKPDPGPWGFKTLDDPRLEAVFLAAWRFREAFLSRRSQPHWLSLLGRSGNGKTHLATCLWNEIRSFCDWNPIGCAYTPQFLVWPDFVDRLRTGEFYGFLNDAKRWPFLVIDDVGAERDSTGFVTDRLYSLLSCRVGRWTILTSNLSLAQIRDRLDERLASRMIRGGSVVAECTAPDWATRADRPK